MLVHSPPQLGPQTAIDEIVAAYLSGATLKSLCAQTSRSYAQLREALTAAGVEIRGPGRACAAGSGRCSAKLTPARRQSLEMELRAGARHVHLAREYGVSREWVRQIARKLGTPSGRQLQAAEAERREREQDARREQAAKRKRAERHAFYAEWRRLWAEGMPVRDMARILGLREGSVGVRIVVLRRTYPEWFPKRAPLARGA